MKTEEIKIGTVEYWKLEDMNTFDKIIEKFSDIDTDYEWNEFVLEDFIEKTSKLGFNISNNDIQFSGFHSQGDGASFEGDINILDYLKSTKQLTKYSALRRAIYNNYIDETVTIGRNLSNYSHENTCYVE
jgi:hypothetical protein